MAARSPRRRRRRAPRRHPEHAVPGHGRYDTVSARARRAGRRSAVAGRLRGRAVRQGDPRRQGVPADIRHGDPAKLLRSLLHEWAELGAPAKPSGSTPLLGEIVCDSVVRAGDRLMPSEAETLLHSLDGVALSLPAPHGRAVLLSLPLTEIDRRFGRWRGRSPCVGFHRSVHDCKVERALREPRTAS